MTIFYNVFRPPNVVLHLYPLGSIQRGVRGFQKANLRTINFLASGSAVNKYANYVKISYHNHFKTGPSISYVSLFRGGWELKMRTIDDMMPILSICHGQGSKMNFLVSDYIRADTAYLSLYHL